MLVLSKHITTFCITNRSYISRYVRRQRGKHETDQRGVSEGHNGYRGRSETGKGQKEGRSEEANLSNADTSSGEKQEQRGQGQISRDGLNENDVQMSEYENLHTSELTTTHAIYEKINGV